MDVWKANGEGRCVFWWRPKVKDHSWNVEICGMRSEVGAWGQVHFKWLKVQCERGDHGGGTCDGWCGDEGEGAVSIHYAR